MSLWVINAGVKGGLDKNKISCPSYIDATVARGTANSVEGPAMTWDQLHLCLERGAAIASQRLEAGCNVIGMGEMGIGNSSAAALVTSLLTKAPLDQTLCPGTGCDAEGLKHKYQVLIEARKLHENHEGPWDILRRVGGFEMAMAAGAMARACEKKMLVLVDGYIMTAVALVLAEALPAARDYMVFCHKSASIGHQVALRHLQAEPLLDLKMRLGEGTGVAVALPLLHAALAFYRDMATFAGAGVATAD
jgi:nicotinate-nucleotide--dimethylbenzimidazole phosphoribosyltransferase